MRALWMIGGLICVGLGLLGVILPLLPTTPLMLLAAFCFARSSERLHNWLLNHRVFGPMIDDWNERGAINPGAKRIATISIAVVFLISLVLSVPWHVLVIQAIALSGVLIFIWSRPNC